MTFPPAVPEVPVDDLDRAIAYYVGNLGFTHDWGDAPGGIAGISRGDCRLFLTDRTFRQTHGNTSAILFWLNLNSKAEVDQLHAEWKARGATILSLPADQPWKLREFLAKDLDGNLIRVFYYDFHLDLPS